jgi:hypothetical protein
MSSDVRESLANAQTLTPERRIAKRWIRILYLTLLVLLYLNLLR